MTILLKSHGLYSYVTGTTVAPTRIANEAAGDYAKRVNEWDINNAKILGFINASTTAEINQQFLGYTTAKSLWDFLTKRYSATGLAHQYQLWVTFQTKRQLPDQPVSSYISEMQAIRDHLNMGAPQVHDNTATLYQAYFNQLHLITILMGLQDKFENVRASLLHRHPLPSLDDAITELLSEETRLQLRTPTPAPSESVFYTPSSFKPKGKGFQNSYSKPQGKPSPNECAFCHSPSHSLIDCPIRRCKQCGIQHPRHLLSECPQNPKKQQPAARFTAQHEPYRSHNQSAARFVAPHEPSGIPIAASASSSPDLLDLMRRNQELMAQLMTGSMGMNPPHSTPSGPSGFVSKRRSPHSTVGLADLSPKPVLFEGDVSTDNIQLPEVLHVSDIAIGLVSLTQLQEMGLLMFFDFSGCVIQDPKTKQTLGVGRRVGRVLEVVYIRIPLSSPRVVASVSPSSSLDLWHTRLGHLSSSRLKMLASTGSLGHVTSSDISCLPCKLGKHHALPFETNESKSICPFDLIHSDVWGPAPHPSMGGARYFVIFVDDHTRFTWIYLMKHRSELPQLYITFARMIQTQFSKPIKILRADNAMEYKESSLLAFLRSQGTISQYSCPGTSPQNGRAERKHRHILDTVRTLLVSAKCPARFWGEAAFTAVYTINRHPSPILHNKSPYEVLHGVLPAYDLLKVWGCACFVQLQPHEHNKLEPRARLCLFLGYGIEHKGYRCWDPVSKRLRISRNVTFWEHVPYYSLPDTESPPIPLFPESAPLIPPTPPPISDFLGPPSDPAPTPPPTPEVSAESPDPGPSTSEPVRRSDRVRHIPAHLRDYHCYATLLSNHEPTSYKEAASCSQWQAAMQEELRALAKAHTWDSVPLPSGKRPIGSKWVFKIKTRSDGSVDRYKARLVAKGFNQEYGIDYEETFAPVARITSVRSLLAIAATKHWPLFQMDVKNAFLNGDLSEEVYMTPPPGVSLPTGHVCRLRKALYGLKQAPRAWFEKFSKTVLSLGFSASNYDSGLFTRTTDSGSILLLLYVDDMIITGDDSKGIASLKQSLSFSFEMKDLGDLHYFLGLEVLSDASGIYLCQAKYVSDLLSKAGLSDNKVASTPLEHNLHLAPNAGTPLQDPTRYRQLVGSLVYLTVTRPDIAYAVHTVSQFMAAPCSDHYVAVLRILRYLKGTMFHGLHFSSKSSLLLRGFSDADWDSDMTDRRSTTGYCFFLGDSLISWRSKKQSLTARSSTEAEYRALADTTQELIWLRWLLSDMGAPQRSPTPLWCDNNSAIQIAHNDVFHERTKHIEIDCHFTRQHVVRNTIQLHPISTLDQPADIFTKAHLPGRFRELVNKLNLSHVNECESTKLNNCLQGHCTNTNGSYNCVCAKGFQGDARIGGECIPIHKSKDRAIFPGIGEGVLGSIVAMIFVYWGAKRRIRINSRKDFFKKNGGIMLQEMLFTCEDPINKGKIFTEEELKKATDNFNNAKIIGQGGYGTVYIGTLANNTRVAIKKSKMMDQSQIKQFVNEVIILSQINHPNIVKLLGCCLETHVPLLVYEYITNNTLCHHIHSHAMLTFGMRLKIATETAEALDFMHSMTQIIHRDVKPSNILLDDEFNAKISDFGISRFVPLDQTHLSTSVKGTTGYIDPEYFRTCKLTEKSDVYSFGVVLMELLMGTEIRFLDIPLTCHKGAAAYLASLLADDALVLALDDQIKKDEYAEVVKCVAKIAINCLDLEGKNRPTMSEIKQEFKQLRCVLFSIDDESI
ncbi:hypothetical protein OSB04_005553 [Centaurea solstitialis]|uniref:Polyprotein n=1 Tax=Centaurea solstitialis TaxID=347529 RepID=A0AA38U0X6_9ASTR|nr:hypothetical protein OSB04_005553 [Centaurea solstitialis]